MYKAFLAASVIAPVIVLGVAEPVHAQSGKAWKCTAPGLVSGSYSGGSSAYIHLSGFSTGGIPGDKEGKSGNGGYRQRHEVHVSAISQASCAG